MAPLSFAKYVMSPCALVLLLSVLIYQETHAYSSAWYLLAIVGTASIVAYFIWFIVLLTLSLFSERHLSALLIACGLSIAAVIVYYSKSVFVTIDYIKLILLESHYLALANHRQVAVFDWGRSWSDPDCRYILIYDESGGMRLPTGTIPAIPEPIRQEIAAKYSVMFIGRCNIKSSHVFDNFYIISNANCAESSSDSR